MKNGLLIWNVVLTLVVAYLLISHFSNKNGGSGKGGNGGTDTTMHKDFRIGYFEMDSVEANLSMVKDVKSELSKKEDAITAELDKMSKDMQQKYNYYQNQAQAGAMTQAQQEQAGQQLKTMDDQLKNRKQALDQEYSDIMMRKMKDIKLKIEDFVREYNKTRGFSYIVAEEPGFFYFKDSTYNITNEVIKGLNDMYKPGKN
jgi:outer membrane protein